MVWEIKLFNSLAVNVIVFKSSQSTYVIKSNNKVLLLRIIIGDHTVRQRNYNHVCWWWRKDCFANLFRKSSMTLWQPIETTIGQVPGYVLQRRSSQSTTSPTLVHYQKLPSGISALSKLLLSKLNNIRVKKKALFQVFKSKLPPPRESFPIGYGCCKYNHIIHLTILCHILTLLFLMY